MSPGRLLLLIAWWAWIPLSYLLIWGLGLNVLASGMGVAEQDLRYFIQENFMPGWLDLTHLATMGWIYLLVGLVGSAFILLSDGDREPLANVGGVISIIATIVCVLPLTFSLINGDKDSGQFYSTATTFYLPKQRPASTEWLFKNADGSKAAMTAGSGCTYSPHDVRVCIKTGAPEFNPDWEARNASLKGATRAITKSAANLSRVDVMESSMTYLYGKDADTGVWSAVMDGSERAQPMHGVAQWDGKEQQAKTCVFRDGYKFNRALHGDYMNDLQNLIAERYPDLVFEEEDVWGYCAGEQADIAQRYPVVVIPMQKIVPYEMQTERLPAGVLELKGSASGDPVMTYKPTVKAGTYPGPVYPLTLVRSQREATSWAAGRGYRDRVSFGFEPATDEVQAGNTSEFLLRDRATRRLWYVTPATPNASKSESIIAYMLTPADQVTDGKLNPLDVRVYPDNHAAVNFNEMVANAQSYLAQSNPGLAAAKMELTEFTPLTDDKWRLFGEMRGVTVLYADVSYSGKAPMQAVSLDPNLALNQTATPDQQTADPDTGQQDTQSGCTDKPSKMAERALVDCAAAYLKEFQRRVTPATP